MASDWLAIVQAQLLRGETSIAQATLVRALAEHPTSFELRRAQAGIFQRIGRRNDAEALLRELLDADPSDSASAFALAHLLKEQGRMAGAASILRAYFALPSNGRDANLAIAAIELLDDCDRKADAGEIARYAIDENPADPRLHAYAGMLEIQLGAFEQARQHYLYALKHGEHAWEWHVPVGLAAAQRYEDAAHPDLSLFEEGLRHRGLSGKARAELHFALGKAHDDVGDYTRAAQYFREANAIAHKLTKWSSKAWRRAIEARLAAPVNRQHAESPQDFTPVFIVGMPRSGTTLLAELLSRHPGVCSRGELPWIARLADRPDLSGTPSEAALQRAAATYLAFSRQDDAADSRWFIDKQPLNFRYIDLILSMFPGAKIIHCRRNSRDTALSLWMQCFLEDVQGYAYAFEDIALVMRDCERLMAHWHRRHVDSIRTVRYEQLVAKPQAEVADLAHWIGCAEFDSGETSAPRPRSSISTASLWQARQPVSARSVERWRHYESLVPELLGFPE